MVAAAVVGGAIIGAVGSSVAADQSAKGARDAAKTQADSAKDANATQLAMYDQTREDQAPWRDAGKVALGQIGAATADGGDFNRQFSMADFKADPGYEFRLSEGLKGVQSSAAARGGLMNGGTLKALTRYGQDYASNEFQNAYNRWNTDRTNRFNRLASLAGIGQTANNALAQSGSNMANAVSENTLQAGNARASGYVAQGAANANAINGGINSLQSMYSMYRAYGGNGGSNSSINAADPAADSQWGGSYAGINNPDNYG